MRGLRLVTRSALQGEPLWLDIVGRGENEPAPHALIAIVCPANRPTAPQFKSPNEA
jgi:hypothetical protein